MDRNITQNLLAWKNQSTHLPLLVRGARQVGKTYIIEQFGHSYFDNLITINFEYSPEYCSCFDTLHPQQIITKINLIAKKNITPGKTLLFLDEIQECPNAIQALRYFKELMPELHIIGAGSLLEFALNDENFRMPVGRIQFIYMLPVSFQEYLYHSNNNNAVTFIKNIHLNDPANNNIHQLLIEELRKYIVLGGMPAVLQEYFNSENFYNCQNLQTVLLDTFKNDFGKYSSRTNIKYLKRLFEKTPGLIGQHFKYVKVDPDMRSRDIKTALERLSDAGLIYPIYSTTASGLPFNALANEKKYKLLFLDVGLANRATHLDIETLLNENLMLINKGAIIEQFVGQELLAYSSPLEKNELFFWSREAHNSMAEVDYLTTNDSKIVPIEVKAGKTGRLKSLHLFMQEKNCPIGVRISPQPLCFENNILSIPLYMISELDRLINEALSH